MLPVPTRPAVQPHHRCVSFFSTVFPVTRQQSGGNHIKLPGTRENNPLMIFFVRQRRGGTGFCRFKAECDLVRLLMMNTSLSQTLLTRTENTQFYYTKYIAL